MSLCSIEHNVTKTRGSGGIAPPLLSSALGGVEWSASRLGHFISEEIAYGAFWIENWLGPRACLDAAEMRKILPLPGIDPGLPSYSPEQNDDCNYVR
jgi:hypothetical protein